MYTNVSAELVDEDTNQCKSRKGGRPPSEGFPQEVTVFSPPLVLIYDRSL